LADRRLQQSRPSRQRRVSLATQRAFRGWFAAPDRSDPAGRRRAQAQSLPEPRATARRTIPLWLGRRGFASPLPAPTVLRRRAARAYWDQSPALVGSVRKPPTNPPSPPATPSVTGLTRRSEHSYGLTELVPATDRDTCGGRGWSCDSARAMPSSGGRIIPQRSEEHAFVGARRTPDSVEDIAPSV
jgi:hypothetical protein